MVRLLLLLALFSASAPGLVVTPEAIENQLAEATLVVDLEVLSLRAEPDPQGDLWFVAQAQVLSRHRGDEVGSVISLRGRGGEFGGRGEFLTGYPRPHVGRRYRAHLVAEGEHFRIVGFEYGLRPLDGKRGFSRNRTDGSDGQGNGAFLFWDSSYQPIPYFIASPTFENNTDFVEAIDRSFATWAEPVDSRLAFLPMGCSTAVRNLNDGINHIILVKENWPFDPTAIAITRNFYIAGGSPKAGLILDSDILLNGVDHQFTTNAEVGAHDLPTTSTPLPAHDVQNIVTHEAGHFIGLGHELNPVDIEATMFAQAATNEYKKRVLKDTDLAGLKAGYGGFAEKPSIPSGASCQAGAGPAGCLAVHNRSASPLGLAAVFALFLTLVGLARRGRRQTT